MASIFRSTLWLRTRGTPPPPPRRPANFIDVLILVLILVTAILLASVFYDSSLRSQVKTDEEQTRALRERVATLLEQLRDTVAGNQLAISETSVPHPFIQDRDSQAIGNHTTVAWQYENHFSGRYVNFELELVKLGPIATDCGQLRGTLECGRPVRFITSDGMNHTSRIPTDLKGTLASGTYAWRVAPVPAGTVVNEDIQKDDLNRLSDWSDYGSFTLFPSVIDRIATTNVIRVGTNLEQDTRFSRRERDGHVTGFDINLIHTLVEQCLALDKTARPVPTLTFDRVRCGNYIKAPSTTQALTAHAPRCPASAQLCVTLVPIQKWGDWQSALKRKEIELFIGAVTAATAREKSGILFTPGYLYYNSHIFGHAADVLAVHSDLRSWLSSPRKIGVIESSTNEYLLNQLLEDADLKKRKLAERLERKPFSSFPAMEHAMDRGELDAVLIDETFVEHDDWKPLEVRGTLAWQDYRDNYLGRYQDEQVAIAVAVAGDRSHESRQQGDLYSALEDALSPKSPVTLLYLPELCKAFWSNSSSYSCPKRTTR
jgi:ABC-type amino acid transport substrate-binding protein